MSTNHNRIKVADLEKNQPDKILITNVDGELEFIDPNIFFVNDLTTGGTAKVLTAEMGKNLQNSKVDKVTGKNLLSDSEIARLGTLSNYTHPSSHAPSIIAQDPSNRFVSDIEKSTWNAKQSSLGFVPENVANKNVANGYAGLGTDGKLISSQLPSITLNDTFVIASQAAMLALQVQTGDLAIRTDLNKSFILKGTNPAVLADWQELLTPTSAVTTVFGRNGAIAAQTGDYNADQINETTTRKFQSTNQQIFNDATSSIQAQLNAKEQTIAIGTTAQYLRGDKTWQTLDKTKVGLTNVDNTTDASKNVLSSTKLTTARTINGISFDGTANITIPINSAVTTVFGRNGAVTSQTGDYNTDQISETATRKFQTANQQSFNDATSSIQTQLNSKASTAGAGASGTWPINVTGNANTAGGLAVHSATNNESNKIVRTDSNGYIQAGWINTVSGDNGSNTINRIFASNDQYLRYYTPANFISTLGLATTTSSIPSNAYSGTPVATYFTTNGVVSGIKVKLPFSTSSGKMVSFTVRLYQSYEAYDIQFSGYLYESIDNWYSPKAVMICGTSSINAIMGKDSDGKAYVWLSGGSYSGAAVFNVVGGYNTADWNTGWSITNDASTPNQALNTTVYPTLNTNNYKNYSAFSGVVSSGNGYQTAAYLVNSRNRIWSFGNADGYGLSYFQGTSGQYGTDSIGIHFGNSTNASSKFIFAGNGDLITTGLTTSASLGIAQTNGNGQGLSLYSSAVSGKPSYGLMFATTSNYSTHGAVSGDWATYLTMDGANNRGWIFRLTDTNVASISATGVFTGSTFVGPLAGNADTATASRRLSFVDGPRNLSDRLPNTFARTVNFDFVNAATVGGSGNYGGVMTFAPWDGLSSSTGDSSYQLAFRNESGINGSGLPGLRLRKGIDTAWGGWYDMLHSGNYAAFSAFSGAITGASLTVTGDVTAFSDARVKENIRPIANVIERIQASRGIVYDRIDTKQKDNIGFIAQELEETFPELVLTREDGTKAVKYQNAVAVLFEAIKGQQTQIEKQQQIIEEQNNKMKFILEHLNLK
ncbi:tail fiber domain-containing protein [Flavobacterium sp. LS1R49]|uniref:Tail fiber domain-containing protein n=1 Tax=Flavobacterium shii TaxID=2987687 RepID=A0A9X2ZCM9_9FLAO|nr:tail fiber domain-containing protein [Flavobacterium shii]MCV9928115.1 tail fiber domain-containing protein [Flavobacterium shii]